MEELVERGPLDFFSSDISRFGVVAAGIEDLTTERVREWHYRGKSYPISGKGIAESAYERAAFALVAILNRMLGDNGSEERAFGIYEGNAYGVAILTEPLRKLLAKVTDEKNTPVPEKILQAKEAAIGRGEPPLARNRGGVRVATFNALSRLGIKSQPHGPSGD